MHHNPTIITCILLQLNWQIFPELNILLLEFSCFLSCNYLNWQRYFTAVLEAFKLLFFSVSLMQQKSVRPKSHLQGNNNEAFSHELGCLRWGTDMFPSLSYSQTKMKTWKNPRLTKEFKHKDDKKETDDKTLKFVHKWADFSRKILPSAHSRTNPDLAFLRTASWGWLFSVYSRWTLARFGGFTFPQHQFKTWGNKWILTILHC